MPIRAKLSTWGRANGPLRVLARTMPVALLLLTGIAGGTPAAADRPVGERFRDPLQSGGEGPEMMVVPAGSFTMGAPAPAADGSDDEYPTLDVHIAEPFAIGAAEVTRGAFARFVEATGYAPDDSSEGRDGCAWRDPGFRQTPDHPVVCVNWYDARAYAAWLAKETRLPYRLPSEAEWEYAAKAGAQTRHPWDDAAEQCRYANGADASTDSESKVACNDGHVHTAPVGSYEPNGYGLADVLGNVREWTQDCWNGSFAGVPADGRAGERGNCGRRLQRGGSWEDAPNALSATARAVGRDGAGERVGTTGFRVARALHATPTDRTDAPPPPGAAEFENFRLRGFFTDPAVLTRIDVRSSLPWKDDGETEFFYPTIRFEHGPLYRPGHGEYAIDEEHRVCRDPETGLDLVFVQFSGVGAVHPAVAGLYRVNPAAGNSIEPVYETDSSQVEDLEDTLIAADGSCRGHALRDADRTIYGAVRALTSGPPAQPAFDVPVGTSLALAPRHLANATVREAFLALDGAVDVAGARYADERDRASWRVVEVFLHVFSGAPGALLVQDRRRQTWHAFYDYRFGAERDDVDWEDDIGWAYRSLVMRRIRDAYVRDDKLYVEACTTGCVGYENDPDEWATFEIDLHAHTATLLEKSSAFVFDSGPLDVEDAPAVPDLAAIAREMPGPAADGEGRAGRWATEAREARAAARRAEAEWVAQRRAWDGALQVGRTFRDPLRSGGEGPEMVVVPAGAFRMGCVSGQNCEDDEKPVHRVTIGAPFAVGVYEVTFAEWDTCVRAGECGGYRPNDEWGSGRYRSNDRGWGRGRRPVINVSWEDLQKYLGWLSRESGAPYRLLSEAEWEYVARAGSETRYSWGDAIGTNRANCYRCGSRWDAERTAPVGSFQANAFGLYDVHGNVGEWAEDCRNGNYEGAPADGTAWTKGDCDFRMARGGAWDGNPRSLRSANRGWDSIGDSIGDRSNSIGFRVARKLTP